MEIFKGVKKKHRGNKKARQYRYEVKKEHPAYGLRRISQVLRRLFFLPTSP